MYMDTVVVVTVKNDYFSSAHLLSEQTRKLFLIRLNAELGYVIFRDGAQYCPDPEIQVSGLDLILLVDGWVREGKESQARAQAWLSSPLLGPSPSPCIGLKVRGDSGS